MVSAFGVGRSEEHRGPDRGLFRKPKVESRKPNQMPIIPEKTCRELGWPQLLAALADRCRSTPGREAALALPFADDDAVRAHLGRVAEARRLAREQLEIPVGDLPDARPHLARARREGVLEPPALLECARLMRASGRVRRFLAARRDAAPALAADADALSDFEPLAAEIERAIEPSGAISDRASALLADLRARARALHRGIKERLDALLEDPQYEEVLRERYYSIRDDRYVVPVKTQHKARLPGIVHNASNSGQTLFVEPDQLVELGNQLTIAQSMAQEEERRILRDLTDGVGRRGGELERDVAALALLDRTGAAARLSDALQAEEPALGAAQEPFHLKGLRHPLLVLRGATVVENDVWLDEGKTGLVVSGPNAGGKTVTLTATGLCALMTRAGLPVPAEAGSRVPLYGAVFTAIGDEGDLARGLSTFTAHLTALRDIAECTGPGTLVLIDEIAADTDPREGAAIAGAMLDELADRGAQVLITTHLDELKAKGLTDARFACASVGFDFERLAPTYRLKMGTAGSSSAIEIARRVGLPARVCDRARALLGGAGGALGRAVGALELERAEVVQLRRALEEERDGLARARTEWDRQRRELMIRERDTKAGLRRELVAEIVQARDEVRRMIAQLQAKPATGPAVEASKELAAREEAERAALAREEEQADALRRGAAEADKMETPGKVQAGQRVKLARLGVEGEVIEIDGAHAVVAMGAMRTRVPVEDLVPLPGKAASAGFKRTEKEKRAAVDKVSAQPVAAAMSRCDLRGLRAEDALRELRSALDRLFREDAPEVAVVHGLGTGALKAAVREELASSPYVETWRTGRPGEGGDGVTIVQLKTK